MATCPLCQGVFEGATFCPKDGTRLESATGTGHVLGGRYRLIRRVGEGAMGVVFEAEHVQIHRKVAVKVLQRRLAANSEAVERMRREAQAMSGEGHPNIVTYNDFGISEDGQVYLVMEWLEGENLDDRLSRAPVDLATALDIAVQACAGLAEAHAQGVIHRDLKPANLFLSLDRNGALRVKILDFGIAKLGAEQAQLTSTGVVIGTPNYMAPEQALGEKVDGRADLYALGIILYEMLAGVVPFQADTPLAVLHQHTARMPALPSSMAPDRRIPQALDTIAMTCLAKDPADRYQTAAELGAALEQVRAGRTSAVVPSAPAPMLRRDRPTVEALAGDSHDDLAVLNRRRPWRIVLAIGAAAVLAGGVGVMLVLGRGKTTADPTTPDAAVVATAADASATDAALAVTAADASAPDAAVIAAAADAMPAPIDASIGIDSALAAVSIDAAATADAALEVPAIRKIERGFTVEARLDPVRPIAGQSTTLVLVLVPSSLAAARRTALEAGEAHLHVTVQHFAHHDLVHRSTVAVDPQGAVRITFVPRLGKHHVSIEPSINGRDLGRTRFDIEATAP